MANSPRQVQHGLGWQDEQMAEVTSCDGVRLSEPFVIIADATEPPRQCPRCGAWLRLEWIVRPITVMPPDEESPNAR